MALRRRHGRHHALLFTTVLPITPLIDVALMLVVFFLMVQSAPEHQVLPVVLPKAATGQQSQQESADVSIDRSGKITFANQQVTLAQLKTALAKAPSVTVHADNDASHGRVIAVVDALRQAGVGKVYYASLAGSPTDW
jgi:biopolymer transport protein ExbD